MTTTMEAKAFVNQHVTAFIAQHREKLNELYPDNKSLRELMQELGYQHIVDAMEDLGAMDVEIEALIAKQVKAIQDFNTHYASIIHDAMKEDDRAHSAFLQKKQEKFEHKIRAAYGLVELVSTERAYEVLENCRQQIRDMKTE